jgi:lipopolysaccharide export LptBFGC system permease protein LptF
MSEFLEVLMVLSFGAAWPASILKSLRAKTTKGKSLFFLMIVMFGYICGIGSKIFLGKVNYVLIFYVINLLMISIDLGIYYRNYKLDMMKEKGI